MKTNRFPCQEEPDRWFAPPGTPEHNDAKTACMDCPVYWSCQEYALEQGIPNGIWGGMDERARARIWKRSGGRPTAFLDVIDAAVRPLLQARRDEERVA